MTPTQAIHDLDALLEAKDLPAAREAAEVIRSSASAFGAFELTRAGVALKEAGLFAESKAVLQSAVSAHPGAAMPMFELGVLHQSSSDLNAAAAALFSAYSLEPEQARYGIALARTLSAVGAHPEAMQTIVRLQERTALSSEQLEVLRDFDSFLKLVPSGRAQFIVQQVKSNYDWLDSARVAAEINKAMDEGRGFALVRLGDGEGPFARISDDDERSHPALYSWLRRTWASLLYGDVFDPTATGYSALCETLMHTCASADIAGLPYPSWIEHEYMTASQRGIPGLINVHRWFLERKDELKNRPMLCRQSIHIDLHRSGHLEPIIRRSPTLALISSNSGLPEMLKSRFGLDHVEFFKIPAEKYSSGMRDAHALAGVHFPFAFWDIIHRLSTPQNGRVVLIAAGTLAKFYAAKVKEFGGVALDIGSLVDGWMRISSRPGYEEGIPM